MAYLEKAGEFHLKPVAWAPFTFPDGGEALQFDFVNKAMEKVSGTFSFTKKDGSPNENIQIFSDAFEQGKSVLCEVQQGKPKNGGGFFYSVKWAVTSKKAEGSTSAEDLKAFLANRKTAKPAETQAPSDEIPF